MFWKLKEAKRKRGIVCNERKKEEMRHIPFLQAFHDQLYYLATLRKEMIINMMFLGDKDRINNLQPFHYNYNMKELPMNFASN